MCLAYVDSRAVQNRLDDVVGPDFWKVNYEHIQGGVMCHLSIKSGDEWVTKSDGAPETQVEGFKGGISKALVRTASVWGVGRYLYDLDIAWARFVEKSSESRSVKIDGKFFEWLPPKLPAWALPVKPTGAAKVDAALKDAGLIAPTDPIVFEKPKSYTQALKEAFVMPKANAKKSDHVTYKLRIGGEHVLGRSLSEFKATEIQAMRTFLVTESQKSGRALNPLQIEFMEVTEAYLKQDLGEIPF